MSVFHSFILYSCTFQEAANYLNITNEELEDVYERTASLMKLKDRKNKKDLKVTQNLSLKM